MPYIGRDLNRGNYLKLDDISSSFDSSTTTFNLTVGGSAFTPGSAFSILVSVGGVIQEPESAYQVNNSEITFANAPTAQDSFFCIALGVSLGIGVPGNGTVNGSQLAKPFNYDGYFYLDDTNNRVGINSSVPSVVLDVDGDLKVSGNITGVGGTFGGLFHGNVYSTSGISTFYDLRISNNLTVEGTTTTLDTNLIGVDRVEIGADSNTNTAIVGIQSGTADIVNLFDGTTEVLTVKDGGNVGIGTDNPQMKLVVSTDGNGIEFNPKVGGTNDNRILSYDRVANVRRGLELDAQSFEYRKDLETRLKILSDGKVGIGTDNPTKLLELFGTDPTIKLMDSSGDAYALIEGDFADQGSIRFRADPLSAGADTHIRFDTDGDERLRIKHDGKVGIGTNNPDWILHLLHDSNTLLSLESVNTNADLVQSDTVGSTRIRSTSGGFEFFTGGDASSTNATNSFKKVTIGSTGISTFFNDVRIVKTSGPLLELTTNTGAADATLRLSEGATGSTTNGGGMFYSGADNKLYITCGTDSTTKRITIKRDDGFVGIGTDDPNMALHVLSTSDDVVRFQSTNSGNGTAITLDHIGGSPADNDVAGKIVFNAQDDALNSTTYADIRCITSDVSNGSETAHLDFSTRGLNAFNAILRLNARSTASAPSYTTDDMNGIILDTYNAGGGSGYERFFSFIAKSAGDTANNIAFWTEKVGGSPTEKVRITSGGDVLFNDTTNSIYNDSSGAGFNFKSHGQLVLKKEATTVGDPLVWLNDTGQTTNKTIVLAQDGIEKGFVGLTGTSLSLGAGGSERLSITSTGQTLLTRGSQGGRDHTGNNSNFFKIGTWYDIDQKSRLKITVFGVATYDSNTDVSGETIIYISSNANYTLKGHFHSYSNDRPAVQKVAFKYDSGTTPTSCEVWIKYETGYSPTKHKVDASTGYWVGADVDTSSTSVPSGATEATSRFGIALSDGTNSTEKFSIASGGEVKIENGGFLTVDTNPGSTYGVAEVLRIDDGASSGDRQLQFFEYHHNGARYHRIQFNTNTTTNGSAYTYTQGNYGGSSSIEFDNSGHLSFFTNEEVTSGSTDSITPTERVRISSGGKVLIPGTQSVSDQTGMLDIYHTAPAEIDSPHIRLWGGTNQDARIEFGSETNVGEGGYISYNDADEGLYIGSRMATYSEVKLCTGMNDGSPHSNERLTVNSVGRIGHYNTTEFDREAFTKGGTVHGGGDATGADSANPGAFAFVNSTPVRGTNTRYSFWTQSTDAYPNASQYIDFTVENAAMYRVLVKGSNSSDTADIAQFLIYGLANNDGQRPPVIEQLDSTPPSFNGDSGSYSPDFHRNSGSFSCIVKGFGTTGGTRGSTGTYHTTLRIQYSGNNNQGLVAFIERWDTGT